jgi:hypothetical protein
MLEHEGRALARPEHFQHLTASAVKPVARLDTEQNAKLPKKPPQSGKIREVPFRACSWGRRSAATTKSCRAEGSNPERGEYESERRLHGAR